LDEAQHLFGPPGLANIVRFQRQPCRRPPGRARGHEQRDPRPCGANRGGEIEAFRRAFQPHVGEDGGGFLRVVAQKRERLGRRTEAASLESGASKEVERVLSDQQFVFDNQYNCVGFRHFFLPQGSNASTFSGFHATVAWFAPRIRSL
jgi:hypothetical protein